MPLKTKKSQQNSSCDIDKRNFSSSAKTFGTKLPKKVLISKKWHQNCSHQAKTKSAGFIESKQRKKPNKTSDSLPAVPKQKKVLDFCKTCGDTDDIETAVAVFSNPFYNISSSSKSSELSKKTKNNTSQQEFEADSQTAKVKTAVKQYYKNEQFSDSKSSIDNAKTSSKSFKSNTIKNNASKTSKKETEDEIIQEHYLNEKFADLYDSMHDFDTILRNGQVLDTIAEATEKPPSSNSKHSSQDKLSRDSNVLYKPPSEDEKSLRNLKEFREKNYFECHSSKNRVENKGSVISLRDHKCRYRLYLNDRLFPVAIDNDHNDEIRCVDCHLPLQQSDDEVNGTIQAKVKLGSKTQDMVLLLPIKEPLIIKQKIKEENDNDVVYFGLVRMDQYGHSIFNPSLPSDSLALRYQRGYRVFNDVQSYSYDKMDNSDVIYI